MIIRIEARALPGRSCRPDPGLHYDNIHVGVQSRTKPFALLGLVSADQSTATWSLACTVDAALDVRGPHIQGRPGARFIYLNWVAGTDHVMFRRAKLQLDAVPQQVLAAARNSVLVARLGLTDAKGNPLCASVRPPLIEWLAG